MAIFSEKKFIYKIVTEMVYNDEELQELLDSSGEAGWEAVNLEVQYEKDFDNTPCRHYRIVFKSSVW